MVKHIVMWQLHEHAEGRSKLENANRVKARLEALAESIPEIKLLEVGLNITSDPDACDIVLYSEFDSREDLQTYQDHPDHVAFKKFIQPIRSEKRVIDYLI
ncbi:MAG: Dabb family protein [Candidatus Zhuqueibacterota bacterium]